MNQTVLELQNVSKVYQMDLVTVTAVDGVSLRVREGEFVAIVGASGSGKSTILHLIGALDMPTTGQVFLDGVNITKLEESKLARLRGKKIGFVFQAFNLYPALNVFENIALPMRIHEFDEKEIQTKVNELVHFVGLEQRKEHLPAQLSGGERQRVAIARALSTSPALILADEPTGNLDTKTSSEIIRIFKELNEKQGSTVILVTHEQEIGRVAQRIIIMRDGKIASDTKKAINGGKK